MKTTSSIFLSLIAAIMAMLGQSCTSNPEERGAVTAILNQIAIEYDANGVWKGATDASAVISYGDMTFSHNYFADWNSWEGFVATRNNDTDDYSAGNWLEHQYTAITGGGISGNATPYMVAYWNSSEVLDDALTVKPSCRITYGSEGTLFRPLSAFVTNTTYAYYAMAEGTAWSKKFEQGDYLKLLAYGITADNTISGPVEIALADYDSKFDAPANEWIFFNLEPLGVVKEVFFRMESSDTGKWGINTPTYFAIDRMSVMPQ
ncbi:MAG: DUF4465 domain-containing protein [Muribaculaceae bacterium]